MAQVNMFQAKTELSKLIHKLETGEETIIYIARNGDLVAQITAVQKTPVDKRIGVAKGKFSIDDDVFEESDSEVAAMFDGEFV